MRLSTALLIAATALPLGGCGYFKPLTFTGPHGRPAFMMACSGAFRSMDTCKSQAEKACPGGYEVIDKPETVPGLQHASGGMLYPPDKKLAVECKASG